MSIERKGAMDEENKKKSALVPRLRFPEFQEAKEWKLEPLGSLAKRRIVKNTKREYTRVLTNSAELGVVDQRDYFEKDIANQGNLEGYYIVEKGDFVYNPRISISAPVGPISKNNVGTGVMSPLYTVFSSSREDKQSVIFCCSFGPATGRGKLMKSSFVKLIRSCLAPVLEAWRT